MNERPALRPSVAVGEALRGVARDILAEARAAIEDPAKSDADAVHDFRRAMKRWRALLRDLQSRTALGHPPRDIIKVIEQQRFLYPELGGPVLKRRFQDLLRENERRRGDESRE